MNSNIQRQPDVYGDPFGPFASKQDINNRIFRSVGRLMTPYLA
jgi:hypothetical protein